MLSSQFFHHLLHPTHSQCMMDTEKYLYLVHQLSAFQLSTKVLTDLFEKICKEEAIPEDWHKGIIIKLPKTGDLSQCDNWRGITLLSVPSKVLCRVPLGRIDDTVNQKLREEQAGFIAGRGCIDEIL